MTHHPKPMLTRRDFARASGFGLLAALLPVSALAATGGDTVIADTGAGRLRGRREGDSLVFRGIPYARVEGRWRLPEPVQPWAGVRDAFAFGARSWQVGNGDTHVESNDQSNACQFLNIWTPALDNRKRPVLFWCHGGGFMSGSANTERYSGAGLNRLDAVVVTINHRLGLFGSLALPADAGAAYAGAGTVGMLDIVAALEWVRDNIADFGGDPGNVTLFGQSGGGGKVMTLMTMPPAAGLFHRAIVQSGALHQTSATPEEGEQRTRDVMARLDTTDTARLLAASDREILEIQAALLAESPPPGTTEVIARPFSPVIHPDFLPEQPFYPEAPAVSASVPLMIGYTSAETRAFFGARDTAVYQLDNDGLVQRLTPILGEDTADAIALYRDIHPQASPSDLFFAITTDQMYGMTSMRTAGLKAAQQGAPVWLYEHAYDSGATFGDTGIAIGAGHGTEVPLVFNNPHQIEAPARADANRAKAEEMSHTWVAFARHGDPNNDHIPNWQPYDTGDRATLRFDDRTELVHNPHARKRAWWQARAKDWN